MTAGSGGALLVGSVPLHNTDQVLRVTAGRLGNRLRRIPDGETGPRSDWILWQYPVFTARPEFEVAAPDGHPYRFLPKLALATHASVSSLSFAELGYAQVARSSFEIFAGLKGQGVIPEHCRFQVSLPTPLSPISAFVAAGDQLAVEARYEAALVAEVATILDSVPHDQLAIQWDANFEFAMLGGSLPAWFGDVRRGVVERLVRLADLMPSSVEVGFHFCSGHERTQRPHGRDMATLIAVANDVADGVHRPLTWLHLPLLPDRIDVAEYEQLALLALAPETELYLGVIQPHDGAAGALARIAAISRYVAHFGVATECGWGRLAPDSVMRLLDLHRAVSDQLVTSGRTLVTHQLAQ